MNKLAVFFFDKLSGYLIQEEDSNLSFIYDDEYLTKPDAVSLSLSLPLSTKQYRGSVVAAFFGGFLPEADIRTALAKKFGISEENDFSFLNRIGGECAGAVSIGQSNQRSAGKPLHEIDLEKFFKQIPSKPLLSFQETRRISLAGAQHKLAVLVENGLMYLPASNEISTHIVKPLIKEYPNSSHNEYFCLELARELGLPVPRLELHNAGSIPYLLIERYDRDGQTRLHQEDFAQALGVSYKSKYEREGGCGYKQCFDLVTEHCNEAAGDKLRLLDLVILNFLLGNNDAHLKNFSLLYRNRGRSIDLAPCYDILSTAIYPDLNSEMSMKLGKEYNHRRIRPGDWEKFADDVNINPRYLKDKLQTLQRKVLDLATVLKNKLLDQYPSEVYDEIIQCIQERSKYAFL